MDIRKAVQANIKGNNPADFQGIIGDAISNGEEKMLPGLGVLFEMIWQSSDQNNRDTMLSTLTNAAK